MKNIGPLVAIAAVVVLLTVAMLATAGWSHPPVYTTQAGFRGLMLGELSTPSSQRLQQLANQLPDTIDRVPPGGGKVTEVYKNVQVLKDLTSDELVRVMLSFAAWVAPADVGCAYCHNPDDLSDDSKYTKRVARQMLKMVLHINKDWKSHVANTGVTCYTCHRGQPLPKYVWFTDPPPKAILGAASNDDKGHPNWVNGTTAMDTDPFTGLLNDTKGVIRVQATQALPIGVGAPIVATEKTYSLMIAISKSLGVNCTYCHNSRTFELWQESSPARVTAWQGIQMVRDINLNYLGPLKTVWPANRLGPTGDEPKAFCATCHVGAFKPLLGVSMAKDYPELGGVVAKP